MEIAQYLYNQPLALNLSRDNLAPGRHESQFGVNPGLGNRHHIWRKTGRMRILVSNGMVFDQTISSYRRKNGLS